MAVNLRTKPIDRRRLSAEDRQSYKPSKRVTAVKRAKAYRGRLGFQNKVEQPSTERKPGTGGFTQGIAIQQARLREEGAKVKRAKSLSETTLYV